MKASIGARLCHGTMEHAAHLVCVGAMSLSVPSRPVGPQHSQWRTALRALTRAEPQETLSLSSYTSVSTIQFDIPKDRSGGMTFWRIYAYFNYRPPSHSHLLRDQSGGT